MHSELDNREQVKYSSEIKYLKGIFSDSATEGKLYLIVFTISKHASGKYPQQSPFLSVDEVPQLIPPVPASSPADPLTPTSPTSTQAAASVVSSSLPPRVLSSPG